MPVLFLAFWIILNSRLTIEVVIIGIVISFAISYFLYKVLKVDAKKEKLFLLWLPDILNYLFTLVIEVIKANITMVKIILSKEIKINAQIVYFKSPLKLAGTKVALANAITLTPGTITVELEDDVFGVHAIDATLAEGIDSSDFVRILKKIDDREDNI